MRAIYAVGNWKMNKSGRESATYIETLAPLVKNSPARVLLAAPFTAIGAAAAAAKDTSLSIGAQNIHPARDGAFTGEISALMLKEAGASFVLVGHSERRRLFGESDEFIREKVVRCLQSDLLPILCIGETESEREGHKTRAVLARQIESALHGVPKEEALKIALAYEPVWAIGTGKTASAETVEETHALCRSILDELLGKKSGEKISILYGGSVKPDHISQLLAKREVDGVLVGGAALDPHSFAQIVMNCKK
jgi:triosephosphate isomerase